eukprot:537339_1
MTQRSLIKRYSIKAQLKLTNTKETTEPDDILNAKALLKSTKNLTPDMETISNALYEAQKEQARAFSLLCNRLTTAPTHNPDDKFSIFLNNMGRVWNNFEEINQMYLINMKDQLLEPLHQFNKDIIPKCQDAKLKLKATKGKYDMKKNSENKILETQRYKNINLSRMHKARSKTTIQFDELTNMRNEFKACIKYMQLERLNLLSYIQKYMNSYKAYADIHSQNLQIQTKMMMNHQRVPTTITNLNNISNRLQLDRDSDTDIHSDITASETMLAFNDWGKRSTVVKEGYFKKRGQVNKGFKKRYFKLFANKKLTYFTKDGPNGILKGHVNLSRILTMNKHETINSNLIHIRTTERMWRFQFDSSQDKNNWYNVIQQTCIEGKGVTMTQTANKFGDMFKKDVQVEHKQDKNKINKLMIKANYAKLNVVHSDFVSINLKFRVVVNNINIYSDKELTQEIFSVQLGNGEVVEGQYINVEVILLTKLKFYIGAKYINEVPMGSPMSSQFYTNNYNIENEISTVDPNDFVAVKMKFRVVEENIDAYVDKRLEEKNLEIELKKDCIVTGYYIDSKVVFLTELKCYVLNTDLEEAIDEYMQ